MLTLLLVCSAVAGKTQELFVYTEPASNMPAHSLGARLTNGFAGNNAAGGSLNYSLIPELMIGVNKNLMVHAEGFFNNNNGAFRAQGAGLYAKYRFFTHDAVYRHFRMAAYGRLSFNNGAVVQETIDTYGQNKGYELGLIATQLLHKQAISASAGYTQVFEPGKQGITNDKAINYSLSTGRLILPHNYHDYKQVNFNIMADLLGQHLLNSNKSYLDIAPAVQFIFNSQTRIDLGYRQQLYNNGLLRMNTNGFLLRFEHTFFNAWK
ncbi:hypothetical protein DXN05_15855 [Deminuibacter soli]|uniref:Type IX secretion system membrane protein PorP/SprF n=1 Tax=Deminuibacter soli TaxID=2291815 RepID=A0A3E1NHU9_9BACT|nr:hypothetical protein DXN05_15855 [Deminuibacter soli]